MLTVPKVGGSCRAHLALILGGVLGLIGCKAPSRRPPPAPPPEPRPTVEVTWREIGRSVQGRPLRAAEFGHGTNATLIFGGYHGDEPVSADLARQLARYMAANQHELSGCLVVVVPEVNPDGLHRGTRKNANGVDLNRNLPASNWRSLRRQAVAYGGPYPGSEPETKAVIRVLGKYRPSKVISIHQARRGPMLDYNGPAEPLARAMAQGNGYKVGMFFGNLPGSLGSYVGMDKGIPIITLELRKGVTPEVAWRQNRAALTAAIHY